MSDKKYPALHELPAALKPWENRKQWVTFKPEERNGKMTKPPRNPHTNEYASVTDASTWGTYDQAVEAVKRFNLNGIGIILTGDLFGIDIDHAINTDGTVKEYAADIIATMDTYTEISPSGDGYHLLALGALPPVETRKSKNTELKIEAYQGNQGRYFTVTGNATNAANINERTWQAAKVCEKYLALSKPVQTDNRTTDILDKARHGANADRFIALYDHGNTAAYNNDHSAATQALVNDLVYWCNGDAAMVDQLFRQSALFSTMKWEKGRSKWDVIHSKGKTYGQLTIENALRDFKPYEELKVFTAAPGKQIPQEKKPAKLDVYRASDLDKEDLTPPDFIIDEILPPGLTIFGASPKIGKSFLALEAASAIANGADFWGKRTKQGLVLYLDIESSKFRVKKRLQSMSIERPADLLIAHRSEQLDNGLLLQLNDFLTDYPNTVAIIIDTLGRVKGASRSRADAYTADTAILGPLQSFALQKGIAVLAITHLRKDNGYKQNQDPFEQITGSNAQFGVADAGWLITGKRGEQNKHFLVTGRDIETEIDWSIERQQDGSWKLMGDSAKISAETEYMDYLTSPVAITIKKLVQSAGTTWMGTSMQLSEEVARQTGRTFVPSDIGLQIRRVEAQLFMYEGIRHTAPNQNGGRKGRLHIFTKDKV